MSDTKEKVNNLDPKTCMELAVMGNILRDIDTEARHARILGWGNLFSAGTMLYIANTLAENLSGSGENILAMLLLCTLSWLQADGAFYFFKKRAQCLAAYEHMIKHAEDLARKSKLI